MAIGTYILIITLNVNGSKKVKVNVKLLSHWLFANTWTVARQAPPSWDFPGKSTGVGCRLLLQGIFPTQGWNPGLLYCTWFLYHQSHREWCRASSEFRDIKWAAWKNKPKIECKNPWFHDVSIRTKVLNPTRPVPPLDIKPLESTDNVYTHTQRNL